MGDCRMNAIHGNIDEVIASFFYMANIARKEGLLSLEDVLSKTTNVPLMVKIGITLIVDGTDPNILHEILTNLMESGDLDTDEKYKEAMVIRTGIEAIQRGENPRILIAKMTSHLGFLTYYEYTENGKLEFNKDDITIFGDKYISEERNNFSREEIEKLLNGDSENTVYGVSDLVISAMMELIMNFDQFENIIGRPCSLEYLASAMHVLPDDFIVKVFEEKTVSNECINEYNISESSDEVNIKRANKLFDLMVGGDDSDFS